MDSDRIRYKMAGEFNMQFFPLALFALIMILGLIGLLIFLLLLRYFLNKHLLRTRNAYNRRGTTRTSQQRADEEEVADEKPPSYEELVHGQPPGVYSIPPSYSEVAKVNYGYVGSTASINVWPNGVEMRRSVSMQEQESKESPP